MLNYRDVITKLHAGEMKRSANGQGGKGPLKQRKKSYCTTRNEERVRGLTSHQYGTLPPIITETNIC